MTFAKAKGLVSCPAAIAAFVVPLSPQARADDAMAAVAVGIVGLNGGFSVNGHPGSSATERVVK